ncbi:MAG: hypothetical protein PHF79_02415 [Candidatus Pacebacteria bacterium]|nr:hypothetical protein [Candidatus Paceibacterota bacterium]
MKNTTGSRIVAVTAAIFVSMALTGCENTDSVNAGANGVAWGKPMHLLSRVTAYRAGRGASDKWSRKGQSATGLPLRIAEPNKIGVAAAPSRFPSGSLLGVPTDDGPLFYLLADKGTDVESGKAAKIAGRTPAEKKAPVFDLCSHQQKWENFKLVTLFPYRGSVPFEKLPLSQKVKVLTSTATHEVAVQMWRREQ